MKKLIFAALMLAAPASAFAQAVDSAVPQSKVIVAVRPDMAAAEQQAQHHAAAPTTARSARVAGKTVRLVDGTLPADVDAAAKANPGS